jgi:uracil-DNA glycosylase
MPQLSLYQQHAKTWSGGCGAEICSRRGTRVCLARGQVPCDVLFIGEAPGESENVLGKPFVGPAGKLLDAIITRAMAPWQVPGTEGPGYNSHPWALTNLVGCIPREEDGEKAKEPDHDDVMACRPRLTEFISICKPRLIVCVGKLARDYVGSRSITGVPLPAEMLGKVRLISITHPAAILRANEAQQSLEVQRCRVTIRNAVAEMT